MQILQRSIVLILALWCLADRAFAGSPLQNQELIERAGIDQQLREFPGSIQSIIKQLFQERGIIDEKLETACADAASIAYDTEKHLIFLDQGLQTLLTPEDKRLLLAHYNSPLGRRITEREVKASSVEAQAEMSAYAQKLMADPGKHADRLALYHEMDKAQGTIMMNVELRMHLLVAANIGFASRLEGPEIPSAGAIKAEVEKHRFAITQVIANQMMASAAYTYRDLPIQDLNDYVTFLNSAVAKKFTIGVAKLIVEGFALQSQEFASQLTQAFARKGI